MIEIELLQWLLFQVLARAAPGIDNFRNRKEEEQQHRETKAVDGRHLLGKQIRNCYQKEKRGCYGKADRNLHIADLDVEWHFVFLVMSLETEGQHTHRLKRETPDHTE